MCVFFFYLNRINRSNFYTRDSCNSFSPQEEQQASNNGDAVTDTVEVQEESNEPLIPDVAHEEKSAAISDVQEVVPQEEKSSEVPTPDKKVGGRGGEDGFDDDPEILQGNVSDDEAITGGLEAPEVESGYFIDFSLFLSFDVFLVPFVIDRLSHKNTCSCINLFTCKFTNFSHLFQFHTVCHQRQCRIFC